MTVATSGDSSAVSKYGEFGDDIGLEDVGREDLSIPRLKILHEEGVFEDTLSGEKMDVLDAILLGVVKQRIMWHSVVDQNDLPMCKSPDHDHGFPLTESDTQPRDKFFPWAKSNFDRDQFPPEKGINGFTTLPCASCIFSEWNKGDWKTPPCSEQHTFPLLYTTDDGASYSPALLTLQRSGIKPSKQYISSFASARRPLFTVKTQISLNVAKRGTVTYSVPKFSKGLESDADQWPEYGEMYKHVREAVRSAPRRRDGDDEQPDTDVSVSNANEAPEPEPAAKAEPAQEKAETKAPAAAPESAPSSNDDDDMPF